MLQEEGQTETSQSECCAVCCVVKWKCVCVSWLSDERGVAMGTNPLNDVNHWLAIGTLSTD